MSCWAARKGRFGAEDLPRLVYSEGARQVPDQQEVAVPSPDRDFNYIEPRIGGEFLDSRKFITSISCLEISVTKTSKSVNYPSIEETEIIKQLI